MLLFSFRIAAISRKICDMLKRLGRIQRFPPGEQDFKCLAQRTNSPSPVRLYLWRPVKYEVSDLDPVQDCRVSASVTFQTVSCGNVCLHSHGVDLFIYFISFWQEAAYRLWKKAGWLKQPNRCVKMKKINRRKERGKKQALFPQESETTLGSLTCNHLRICSETLANLCGSCFYFIKSVV